MPKKVLADSCYWMALLNERDTHHAEALAFEEELSIHTLVVPWPTLYETINTRLMRRKEGLIRLKAWCQKSTTKVIDDKPYKQASLKLLFDNASSHSTHSLVDQVIRLMIVDKTTSIDAVITFNAGDFYDVCDPRGIELPYR